MLANIVITIICIIINYIYSLFSHGISSIYMTYMFIVPLISLIINHFIKINCVYYMGIITLIVGLMVTGIFEIAGTSSNYIYIYYIIGLFLIIISFIYNNEIAKKKRKND